MNSLSYIETTLKKFWDGQDSFIDLQERIVALKMILEKFGDAASEGIPHSRLRNVTRSTSKMLRYIQGGPKNKATLHFRGYPFFRTSSKLQKIILRFFLYTSRPVFTEHAYDVRLHSFHYLKWRRLVNRLPFDNAALKLQHHGVGRRLAHRATGALAPAMPKPRG